MLDNVDVAIEVDADGVHIGQDDDEIIEVRRNLEVIKSLEFQLII